MNRKLTFVSVLFLALLALAGQTAQAANVAWTGTTANWTSANWSQFGGPTSADIAYVGNNGTVQVNSAVPNVGHLYLGQSSFAPLGDGTVELNTGADLTVLGSLYLKLSANRSGTLNHNDGALKIGASIVMDNAGGTGVGNYNLVGGTLSFTNAAVGSRLLDIARDGTFDFAGGSVTGNPILKVGSTAGAFKSVVNLHGNTLNTYYVEFALPGSSVSDEINLQNGTLTTTAHFQMGGSSALGGAIMTVDASDTLTVGSDLYVGAAANNQATINQDNGAVNVGGTLYLGNNTGTDRDYYNLINGNLVFNHATPANRVLDIQREATFDFQNGGITGNPVVKVGSVAGTFKSIFNLHANTLNANYVEFALPGSDVADEFNFQNGTVVTTAHFQMGGSTSLGGAIMTVDASDTLTVGSDLYVGAAANNQATINQDNGTVNVGGTLYLGNNTGTQRDYYNLINGNLTFNHATPGNRVLDIQQEATFDYQGGAILGTPILKVGSVAGNVKSIFNLHGHVQNFNYVDVSMGLGNAADEVNFQSGRINTTQHFQIGGSTAVGGTIVTLNSGERLDVGTNLHVGSIANAQAQFNQTSGTLNIVGTMYLAQGTGLQRDYFNLNSGTLTFTHATVANRIIDIQREGTFEFFGGSIAGTPTVNVGSAGDNGLSEQFKSVFNLHGNTLNADSVNISMVAGAIGDEFNFQNGTVNTTAHFQIGGATSGTGTVVNVDGSSVLDVNSNLHVGSINSAKAVLNQNGGAVNVLSTLYLSQGSGTERDFYNLINGNLTFDHLTAANRNIEIQQNGTFDFQGGAILGNPLLNVGSTAGANKSIFNLHGNTFNSAQIIVGNALGSEADEFNFQGGKVTTTGYFLLGGSTAVGGTVISLGTGAELTTGSHLYVGYLAGSSGSFQVNGGTLKIGDDLILANGTGTETDYFRVNSGTAQFTGATPDIFIDRQGLAANNGGTITGVRDIIIGNLGTNTSVYEQTAGTTTISGVVTVASAAGSTGQFNMSGGTFTMSGSTKDFYLSRNASASVSGGTMNVGQDLNMSALSGVPTTFNQSGGTINVARHLNMGNVSGAVANYNLTGGKLVVAGNLLPGALAGSTGNFVLGGGKLHVGGILNLNAPGTENFTFNSGELSAVTLNNTTGALIYNGGTISPGLISNVLNMTINGNLTMPSAAGLMFDLKTPNVIGGVNDLLTINGNLFLSGIVGMNALPGFTEGLFPIIKYTGTLSALNAFTADPTLQFLVYDVNDVDGFVYLMVIPVPEPSSGLLLGLGALALVRRRRQK